MANGKRAPGQPGSAFRLGEIPALSTPSFGGPFSDIARAVGGALTGRREAQERAVQVALQQAQVAQQIRAGQTAEKRAETEQKRLEAEVKKAELEREKLSARADAIRAILAKRKDMKFDELAALGDEDVIQLGRQFLAPPSFAFMPVGERGEIAGFQTRGGAAGFAGLTGVRRPPTGQQSMQAGAAAEAQTALQIMRDIEARNPEAAETASKVFATGTVLGETGPLSVLGRSVESFRALGIKDPDAQSYYQAQQALRLAVAGIRGQRPNQTILAMERSLMRPPNESEGARVVRFAIQQRLLNELERRAGLEITGGTAPTQPAQPAQPTVPSGIDFSKWLKKENK